MIFRYRRSVKHHFSGILTTVHLIPVTALPRLADIAHEAGSVTFVQDTAIQQLSSVRLVELHTELSLAQEREASEALRLRIGKPIPGKI